MIKLPTWLDEVSHLSRGARWRVSVAWGGRVAPDMFPVKHGASCVPLSRALSADAARSLAPVSHPGGAALVGCA